MVTEFMTQVRSWKVSGRSSENWRNSKVEGASTMGQMFIFNRPPCRTGTSPLPCNNTNRGQITNGQKMPWKIASCCVCTVPLNVPVNCRKSAIRSRDSGHKSRRFFRRLRQSHTDTISHPSNNSIAQRYCHRAFCLYPAARKKGIQL